MSAVEKMQNKPEKVEKKDFRTMAKELAESVLVKKRSMSGKTYLSRFVSKLNGKTRETGMTRLDIIADISGDIEQEKWAKDGGFDFKNEEHVASFTKTSKKVQNQVAAAISDSQNNTSLSFNPETKDKYSLNRDRNENGEEIFWITEK